MPHVVAGRAVLRASALLGALLLQPIPPAHAEAAAGPLVLVVRHAEKATEPADDPPLSPAGTARAEALAAALEDAGVTAIVTTQYRRSRETAQPLATALGLTPEVVIASRGEEHATAVAAAVRRHGGVVLVVGHSNTVPAIIAALGGPRMPDLADADYDDLFVVAPATGGAKLVRTRYGAAD